MKTSVELWGALWRSKDRLDGEQRHLLYDNYLPVIFRTRRETREWIEKRYGYIRGRKDLRSEPHGWRMPIPVKIEWRVREF